MKAQFDKYPERIPRILRLAKEEARRLNHKQIHTGHILLGLIKEEESLASLILTHMGVSLPKMRSAVDYVIGYGKPITTAGLELTRGSKKAIEMATTEARQMGHEFVDSGHMLLGLLGVADSVAVGILDAFGVTIEKIRAEVTLIHPASKKPTSKPEP
jgi:ATP-dependent Clp protease ATP-binding subunit ClpC